MAQVMLLGLGGTGSRVVNNVALELKKNNIAYNDGNICCAVLDTNRNDTELIKATDTGIPVIATSGKLKVGDILDKYDNFNPLEWCPVSGAFREETFSDGASELRVKSRIAMMDSVKSGRIRELETQIESILNVRGEEKIRVLLVSSLSGGTGSGMFIETALWIRKFFEDRGCDISIRGILLLPDIFVKTIGAVRGSTTKTARHYANAYAAIRELNAITKAKRYRETYKPVRRIKLGDFFDSDNPGSSKPVFDIAFFIDNVDANGASFSSSTQYEKMAAQVVYMQLFAPMATDLRSVEDNQFITNFTSFEPLYGSCGTAKAVYPTDDVIRYCALKAASASINSGWSAIDYEIESERDALEERRASGELVNTDIDVADEYIRRFENKSGKTGEDALAYRFFVNAGLDTKNVESVRGDDDSIEEVKSDKVEDFIKGINGMIAGVLRNRSKLKDIPLSTSDGGDSEAWLEETHTMDDLSDIVDQKRSLVISELEDFDRKYPDYVADIVSTLFPLSMGEIGRFSKNSIYGLLTKKDSDNKLSFVHPVAARYMLYRLEKEISRMVSNAPYDSLRSSAQFGFGGGNEEVSFDNVKTDTVETSPEGFLASRTWTQRESKFIAEFKSKYEQFNKAQVSLCRHYETVVLTNEVMKGIKDLLSSLIKNMEKFFENLKPIARGIEEAIQKNIARNSDTANKIHYVCASETAKNAIYDSLRLDVDAGNDSVNESVIKAVYGKLCGDRRPKIEANLPYVGVGVSDSFVKDIVVSFAKYINSEYSDKVRLTIYQAICLEADINSAARAAAMPTKKEEEFNFDDETLEVIHTDKPDPNRYRTAFIECVRKVEALAAPFLMAKVETPTEGHNLIKMGDGTSEFFGSYNDLIFWGFNPILIDEVPDIGSILLVNENTQKGAYHIDELYCYHGLYGVQAGNIPKFNEKNNGDYYRSYVAVLSQMLRGNALNDNDAMLVITPHLDKTWHDVLPYVSPEMNNEKDKNFYRALLLGLAYGKIVIDKNGCFAINKEIKAGDSVGTSERSIFHNGRHIGRQSVSKLIAALHEDALFMLDDAVQIDQVYEEDIADHTKFHNTRLYNALTTTEGDLNVVTVITRLDHAADINNNEKEKIRIQLMDALDGILDALIAHYDETRSEAERETSKNNLRKKVFDGCGFTKEKYDTFAAWGFTKPEGDAQ